MKRPTRYLVEYEDREEYARLAAKRGTEDIDPADYIGRRDFTQFAAARRFASSCQGWALLRERIDIRDKTPPGDPPGLLWSWREQTIHPPE